MSCSGVGSSRLACFSTFLLLGWASQALAQEKPPASSPDAAPPQDAKPAGSDVNAAGDTDEDYEVDASTDVEATPSKASEAPPSSAPVPPGSEPSAAPPASPSSTESTSVPEATASAPVAAAGGAEPALAQPSGVTNSGAKAEEVPTRTALEREGSNYRRRLKPGFAVSGFIQAQYQNSQLSQDQLDPDGATLNQDEFGVRRARVRLDHGWGFGFATLEVDAGTLGGVNLRIRRAEASVFYRGQAAIDETPWVVLTAGVTDLPFGGELGESQRDRLFMEQSIASRALFPTPADVGVKLWGAYQALEYGLAVVNGEPTTGNGIPTDPNAHKDISARVGFTSNLSEKSDLGAGASFYTGQGFSAGTPGSKDTLEWIDINNNGSVDGGEILGITGSSPIPSQNFERWAAALDFHARIQSGLGLTRLGAEAYLASNMDRGVLPSDPVASGADANAIGGSVYVVQQLAKYFLLGLRAAYYDPTSSLLEQHAGEFHLKDQSYVEISPTVGVAVDRFRLSFEYDFLFDHLGRDALGVPTDAKNDHFTLRLAVDL
jgi:hypothetical protein